jgi:long-chain acyl-CoA synthetase
MGVLPVRVTGMGSQKEGFVSQLRPWLGPRSRTGYVLRLALLTGAYVAAGKLGLHLAFATNSVTAIWPPTGIALAAILLGGRRMWPAIAVGALLTNIGTGVPAVTVLGITLGNTLEALAGAWLLQQVPGFDNTLRRVRDVLALVALAAGASTMVSATIGVASLLLGDAATWADAPSLWRTWWLGDMGGDLIVAPVLLVAVTHVRLERPPGRLPEGVVLAAAVGGVSAFVFSHETGLTYLLFPLLIWSALRFWQPGAAVAGLIAAVVAVACTTALLLGVLTRQRMRAEEALRGIASTLQEGLLQPQLPQLPQLEIATYFRAVGEGQQVGGDFYDLFQAGDGSWALTVGDVRGKGPAAAAMTALARYTLRAAALHETRPSRVLALLNEAIMWQHGGEDFASVAYLSLDLGEAGASVSTSSGGHPLPVVLRADGSVDVLGEPGLLLGVDAKPELFESRADLAAGDTLVLYTDGLLDAYAPGRYITAEQLERVLSGCAGMAPAELLAELEERLLHGRPRAPRDDIAVVAIRIASGSVSEPTKEGRMSENLATILTETAAKHGDHVAVKLDQLELSYSMLDGASAHVAGMLREKGVRPGDRVGIMLPNVPHFPVVYYGVLRAGAVVVPMNVLLKAREVEFYLSDPEAKLVFAWHDFAEAAEMGAEAAGTECVLVKPGEFEQLVGTQEPVTEVADRAGDDTAVILYTSGTTGQPKGAELTHDNLRRNCTIVGEELGEITHDDVLLGALPLFHSFGQTCGMNATVAIGATLTMIPRFDPEKALEIIQRDKVSIFQGVPTMYNAMLHCDRRDEFDVSCLRLCMSGGSAMPEELMRNFEEVFGCIILEGYGLSETSPVASFNHPDRERKPGSIGTPINGVEMKLLDDDGHEVQQGEIGEIAIKGHNIMKGYWNRPEANAEAIKDGWFLSGDMGKVDEDGYFFIVDRKKELIIRGGYNVYPREIEEVLYEHPAVQEAAVIGIEDEKMGEEVGAAVVLKKGEDVSADELKSYVKEQVAGYKYPRRIWFADELPKGPTGKILKREIEVPQEVAASST